MNKFGTVEQEDDGGIAISLSKGLSFWEQYGEDPKEFESIVVDTGNNAKIRYDQIPELIEYFTLVFLERVAKNNRTRIPRSEEL